MNDYKEFLNKCIDNKNDRVSRPTSLFKYRPFDEYSFDMLENEYIYLCKAENLDDPSECVVSINIDNLYDVVNDTLRRECCEQILKNIKTYTSDENYEIVRSKMYMMLTPDFKVRRHFLLEFSSELQEMAPGADVSPLVNWFANIPEMLDKPEMKSQINLLLLKGINARKETGVCSLAESSDIDDMWKNYADNDTGYCVEYDFTNFENLNELFPVVYEDNKETNIVMQLIATFLGQIIYQLSQQQLNADRSQYLRLFLTKDTKWAYQKEWRVIDEADKKLKAPKIKRIIVGKNASESNIQRISSYCFKKGIAVEMRGKLDAI